MNVTVTISIGVFQTKKSQLYTSGSVDKLFSKCWKLFFSTSSSTRQFGFKPKMPLPVLGPADKRHQTLFMAKKKKHAQHFLKLLMFYPIIHRPGTWEYVFVGKPWLDLVEPASLVPVSPGWHVWKLLPQSISKVQVLKYLSRQSFILAVGSSEHSSCTLKGYSESHIWARVHLEINEVPLTGWVLSATRVH